MLEAADVKLRERGAFGIDLVEADALALPFASAMFDCVTSGFLLRNVADLPLALSEMFRVLRPGGRAVSLELTPLPPSPVAGAFASYFQHVVPWIGGRISGDPMAYSYLPASVRAFPTAPRLGQLFREAGFEAVSYRLVGFGTVAIHTAVRT
jgi:demethylmenaquinone methyltransferase/2-methoxy-6-polyprenyl-1,4-benzoquinol methylase